MGENILNQFVFKTKNNRVGKEDLGQSQSMPTMPQGKTHKSIQDYKQ